MVFELGVLKFIAIFGSARLGTNESKLIFVPGGVGILPVLYVIDLAVSMV